MPTSISQSGLFPYPPPTISIQGIRRYGCTNCLKKKIDEVKSDSTAILTFQDEVHFQIQTTITRGWYEKGSAPKVKSFPARFKSPYSGFVIPETGELFMTKTEKFNYETTIASIREFLAAKPLPEGKHYVLVMDNAPWHKKAYRLIAVESGQNMRIYQIKLQF